MDRLSPSTIPSPRRKACYLLTLTAHMPYPLPKSITGSRGDPDGIW